MRQAWGQSVGQTGSGEAGKSSAIQASPGYVPTLKRLPRDILADQKFLWVRPFRVKVHDIPLDVSILGATAGLIAIDKNIAQSIADSPPGSGYAFSHRVSQAGGLGPQLGVCSTFYLLGHWRDNERSRTTGLLGMRAVLDAEIIVEGLKRVSQRPRPTTNNGITLNHNADGEFFAGGNSFPSGHAAESWALAVVISNQYQDHRWVPPVAYGLAGLVSVARVTGRRHFPSDVFVGAALGYLIGRYVSRGKHEMR
jgi:membrane-associated phospholipid phosphatase